MRKKRKDNRNKKLKGFKNHFLIIAIIFLLIFSLSLIRADSSAASWTRAYCLYSAGAGGYACDSGQVSGDSASCSASESTRCAEEGNVFCYAQSSCECPAGQDLGPDLCDASGTTTDGPLYIYDVDWDGSSTSCNCYVGSGKWNIGFESGTSGNCCGDDSSEYKRTRVAGTDSTYSSDPGDDRCCTVNNKCVYSDTCYNSGSTRGAIPNENYCNAGTWQGGDAGSTQCSVIVGSGNWNLGGEVSASTCCGDDSSEYKRTRVCSSGCTSDPADDGCCSGNSRCVYNSVCYSSGTCVTGSNLKCSGGSWQDHCTNGELDCDESSVDCGGAQCISCGQIDSAYWADLQGNQITGADYNDYVMLVAETSQAEGKKINFDLWEEPGRCFDQEPYDSDYAQDGKAKVLWQVEPCGGNQFKFKAELDINPTTFEESALLAVNPTENNTPPVAIISEPSDGDKFDVGEDVNLVSGSYDEDDPIETYLWEFGDGSTGNQETETHPYDTGGGKNIKLTVWDKRGVDNSTEVIILIDNLTKNDAPAAIISEPHYSEIFSGLLISFDGSKSVDDQTLFDDLIFTWDLDDGSSETKTGGEGGAVTTHLFTGAGPHTAKLTVDDSELTGEREVQFEIQGCEVPEAEGTGCEFIPYGTCCERYFCDIDGAAYYDTMVENCEGADGTARTLDDCCPRGFYCPSVGAACIPEGEDCELYTEQGKAVCEENGCIWLENACVRRSDLTSCSGYTLEEDCNNDPLGLGKFGGIGLGTQVCGKRYGDYVIPKDSCKCEWENGECKFSYGINKTTGEHFITCLKSFTPTDCIAGKQTLDWIATCLDGANCGTPEAEEQCSSGQKEIKCGVPVSKLGFFSIFNLIAASLILAAYYAFFIKKEKK